MEVQQQLLQSLMMSGLVQMVSCARKYEAFWWAAPDE
jgi:hypothetical protein